MSLLLPAVQFARESARRVQCSNNLKQMGAAFHTHHDTLKCLPHAGLESWEHTPRYVNGAGATGDQQWCGWGYQILPYIEQQAVFDGNGKAGGTVNDNDRRIIAISTPIPSFYCPTRRPARALPPFPSWYPVDPNRARLGAPGTYGHGATDYASAFVNSVWAGRNQSNGSPWIVQGDPNRSGAVVPLYLLQGTTGESPPDPAKNYLNVIGFEGLADGTSNVILLGEKRLNRVAIGSYQTDDNEGYTASWDHDVNRNCSMRPLPDPIADGSYGEYRFGSSHPAGFQVLMGDGSVKFMPYTVNELLFHRLGCRNDHEAAAPP